MLAPPTHASERDAWQQLMQSVRVCVRAFVSICVLLSEVSPPPTPTDALPPNNKNNAHNTLDAFPFGSDVVRIERTPHPQKDYTNTQQKAK